MKEMTYRFVGADICRISVLSTGVLGGQVEGQGQAGDMPLLSSCLQLAGGDRWPNDQAADLGHSWSRSLSVHHEAWCM